MCSADLIKALPGSTNNMVSTAANDHGYIRFVTYLYIDTLLTVFCCTERGVTIKLLSQSMRPTCVILTLPQTHTRETIMNTSSSSHCPTYRDRDSSIRVPTTFVGETGAIWVGESLGLLRMCRFEAASV